MTSSYTVVFDLDGTLIDSGKIVHSLINDMRIERGLLPLDFTVMIPYISTGGSRMMMSLLDLGPDECNSALNLFRERYLEIPTDQSTIYSGLELVLNRLRSQDVNLTICTNKPRSLVSKILDETFLGSFFRTFCAGDDLETAKPNPQNLYSTIKANCRSKPIIMVGDSKTDQELAWNCSIPFVFFESGYNDGVNKEMVQASFDEYGQDFLGKIVKMSENLTQS
jgi:phosphoglycolate phosphatase